MSDKRQTKSLFLNVRRLAADLARRCDFVTESRILKAEASCSPGIASVCVEYKDRVERAQIITAFTYGASLLDMNFQTSRLEDIRMENGLSIVTITLSDLEGK